MQVAGYTLTRLHLWPNKVGVGWQCCPAIVWEPIMEMSSHATHQGTLGHSRPSLLNHCGLILAWKKAELVHASWSPLLKKTHTKKTTSVDRESVMEPSPSSSFKQAKNIRRAIIYVYIFIYTQLSYMCQYCLHFDTRRLLDTSQAAVLQFQSAYFNVINPQSLEAWGRLQATTVSIPPHICHSWLHHSYPQLPSHSCTSRRWTIVC